MNESCRECLVKKKITAKDTAIRFAVIFAAVLAVLAGLFLIPAALLAALVLGIASYFVIQNTDLEYEYTLIEKSLDIDKIMAKTRRKRLKSYDLNDADLIAPISSHRMDYYNSNSKLRTIDYTSGTPEGTVYAVIIKDGNETAKVLIEPDEVMAQMMNRAMPGKCFLA